MLRTYVLLLITLTSAAFQPARPANPVIQGWYADPEAHVFQGEYWIYPTYSAPYDQQTFMDALSCREPGRWSEPARILAPADVRWATRAMWRPSIVEKDGWYYWF